MVNESKSILEVSGVINISAAVAVRNDNKLLLVREDEVERKGLWGFPSGKATMNELIFQTAEREFLEETGYKVRIVSLVSVYYYATKGAKHGGNISGQDRITVRFNFMGELQDKVVTQTSAHEVREIAWMADDEVRRLIETKKLRNWMNTRFAEEVLAKQSFPLDIVFTK